MQTYAEAESNANLFAFACFARRGGSPIGLTDATGETGMQAVRLALPRREPRKQQGLSSFFVPAGIAAVPCGKDYSYDGCCSQTADYDIWPGAGAVFFIEESEVVLPKIFAF